MGSLPDRLWTHNETARFLGLAPATLHTHNHRGTGPRSYKVGKRRLYDPADIAAFLEERASAARATA